ncbi:MAG: hypothetical protein AAFX99_12560, partial [Myxococcota bacterium]
MKSIALFFALAAALVACGGDDSSGNDGLTSDECGGACPPEQCRFGTCVGATNNSTGNGTGTTDGTGTTNGTTGSTTGTTGTSTTGGDPVCDDNCAPPGPVCDGDTLVTTTGAGMCVATNTCDYSAVEMTETCPFACDNGACTDGSV